MNAALLLIQDSRHGLERAQRQVHATLVRVYADKQNELLRTHAATCVQRAAQRRTVEQEYDRVWDRWVQGCSSETLSKLQFVGVRARVLATFVADRYELFGLSERHDSTEVFQAMLDEVDPKHMAGAVDDFLYRFIWERAWLNLDAEERNELVNALRQIDVPIVADDLEQAEGAASPDFMAVAAGINDELVAMGLCTQDDIDIHDTKRRLEVAMKGEGNRPSKASVVAEGVKYRLTRKLRDELQRQRERELPQVLAAAAAARDRERAKQKAKAERSRNARELTRQAQLEAHRLADLDEPEPVLISSAASAEENAARWMRFYGYEDASVTPPGPDNGLDVVGSSAVAQVKAEATKTGGEAVQRFFGAAADGHGGKERLFFSNSGYTAKALGYADRCQIALFTFDVFGQVTPVNQRAKEIAAPKAPKGT